eukprot:13671272-Heterocapsa_arctica.AAC.1
MRTASLHAALIQDQIAGTSDAVFTAAGQCCRADGGYQAREAAPAGRGRRSGRRTREGVVAQSLGQGRRTD